MLILTDESPWPLFDDLDAECAGRVGLVRVALHGDVALGLERPVDAAVVIVPVEIWVVCKAGMTLLMATGAQSMDLLYHISLACFGCIGPQTILRLVFFGPPLSCIGSISLTSLVERSAKH